MISKTKLKVRIKRKTNPSLVDTLQLAREHPQWNRVAHILSGATRRIPSINLTDLDAKIKEGDTVVFPGKILGIGSFTKKGVICALSFSKSARTKLEKNKNSIRFIRDEIQSNPDAKGVVLL